VWFDVTNHNLLQDPAHLCIVAEMVDISEEMAAHEEVREHEELLEQLAEAMPLGLLKLDSDGRIVYPNARLHEIVGVGRVSTARAQLAKVASTDRPVVEQALEAVLREGRPADIEVQLRLSRSRLRKLVTGRVRGAEALSRTLTAPLPTR
jgi:PAS domain-containing protein